ncbi:MAG: flagellin [Phycisphaerales bacterium]|nr:flagellin [Phycisphaerales bacterium]
MINGISSNAASNPLLRTMRLNDQAVNDSLAKLATGHRINRAADGPAALISSEQLRAVLAELEAEGRSLQRVDHVASTVDGALGEIAGLLSDANEHVVAASGDGFSDAEREAHQIELSSIVQSVNLIANNTSFNGESLLDGGLDLSALGASVHVDDVHAAALTAEVGGTTYSVADLASGLSTSNPETAQSVLKAAMSKVDTLRGEIGAFQSNTVQSGLDVLRTTIENVASAESMIRDTDVAAESARLVRGQILQQASSRVSAIGDASAALVLDLIG